MFDSILLFTSLAVLLRIVSNPLANVFQKQLTQNGGHPMFVNFCTYFLLSALCLWPIFTVNWLALPVDFWLYSLLAGLVGALGNSLLVKALQTGDLSVLGPINSYKSVISIVFGVVILGEIPSWWGLLGIALIVYGSYFVLDGPSDRFSLALFKRKEIQYRIGAMVLTAIEAVFVKKIILNSSVVISFISWCWFGMLFSFFLLLLYKVKPSKEFLQIRSNGVKYLSLVLCIGIMQLTTNYVFDKMQVGCALALFQISIILSVLFGYHIFKEGDLLKKLIGSLIMIVGTLIIIFLN